MVVFGCRYTEVASPRIKTHPVVPSMRKDIRAGGAILRPTRLTGHNASGGTVHEALPRQQGRAPRLEAKQLFLPSVELLTCQEAALYQTCQSFQFICG